MNRAHPVARPALARAVEERSSSGLLHVVTFAFPLEIVERHPRRLIPVTAALPARERTCALRDARRYLTALGVAVLAAAGPAIAADSAFADVHITSSPTPVIAASTATTHPPGIATAITVLRAKPKQTCRDALLRAPSNAPIQRDQQLSPSSSTTCSVPSPAEAGKETHHPHVVDLRRHRPRRQPVHREVSGGAPLYVPHATSHRVAHRELPLRAPANTAHSAAPEPSSAPTAISNAGANVDRFTASELRRFPSVAGNLDQPPRYLIPIYKAAGRRYHVQWQILAAINAIETDYGQDLAVSPKGAVGWMQFMPGTWLAFGTAADGRHRPNPYDPHDAIFSAARYLAANGGSRDIRRALFAYNHALWYVDAVLWRAQLIGDGALSRGARRAGYSLPLDGLYMRALGRTDDGVDIEDAPDGAAVYSITPGVVTAVASDPAGFGPDYPVILATRGPLTGQFIYYGHVAASLVHVGQQVVAGEPIAVVGHTGDAESLGHGHIEIGFSDGSGDPLNHHGATAWTPSGDAMRRVLTALSTTFHTGR